MEFQKFWNVPDYIIKNLIFMNIIYSTFIRYISIAFLTNYIILWLYICICNFYRCAICMCDFVLGESLRFLPCMHVYHKDCIDDWLMRAFTCPSCMEPVDAALLSSYQSNWSCRHFYCQCVLTRGKNCDNSGCWEPYKLLL